MPSLDDAGLSPRARSRIEATLACEPALEAELAAIAEALDPAARRLFWFAFAAECERHARPAAAALAALERAARARDC